MGNILLVYKDRIKNYTKLKKIFYTLKLVTLFKIATNKKTRKKMYKHQLHLSSFLLQTNIIQSDFFLYKNTGIMLFTSQKGICSNFNLLIVQGTLVLLEKLKIYNTDNVYLYVVGSKGLQGLSNNKNFDHYKDNIIFCLKKIKVENLLSYEWSTYLLKSLLYNNLNIDQFIFIYYSLNYKTKEPQLTISLIPTKTETNTSLVTVSYETYWRFINFYLAKTIHSAYIINTDVEERCRFQHLEEIVKNLEDLIFTTTIRYNFIRQEQITRSILELF